GAVVQMVSHGLLTGALFLLSGVLWDRAPTYDFDRWGGLAAPAPRFAALFAVAAFGSLGLPGLSGFVAEFQVFTGALQAAPVLTVLAVTGILVTAGLFLLALQRLFTGAPKPTNGVFADVGTRELVSIAPLLALSVVIGLLPRPLLALVEPGSRLVAELVAR
ncbi:MAG TPA: proton-conducting transporter membrane subunit, partial [Actinomycetales bacterium]|nr:proton-conducting transporter membrane subunit [Actinomycetales bacterium]